MRKALVTGASEGIGRAFAKKLAKDGYCITAVARNEEQLESLMKELGTDLPHSFQKADLTEKKDLTSINDLIASTHWDLLVNNAGRGQFGEFSKMELDSQLSMIDLNVKALVALAHGFLKQAKKGDALINVSSVVGFLPYPPQGVYAATKAFVNSFTQSLWYENKGRGVFVMGLCPGPTKSQFLARSGSDPKVVPGYVWQTPEQVVNFTLKKLKRRRSPLIVSGMTGRCLKVFTGLVPDRISTKVAALSTPDY